MPRTTEDAVEELLSAGGDYDTLNNPSLIPFIQTANVIVTRVVTCATEKGITLSTEERELIERWLSAHFYVMSDQTYAAKGTEGASATFHGQTGMNLDASKYGQTAKMVDYSGCLNAIGNAQRASLSWLGKRPSEQTDYSDRD